MPVYEYKCRSCGKTFETLVKSSSESIACPSCGSGELTKLYSTFSAHGNQIPSSAGSSSCATCSGGSCSTCH